MVKRARGVPVVMTPLDPAANVPLHRQLYEQLRDAILAGQLRPGAPAGDADARGRP